MVLLVISKQISNQIFKPSRLGIVSLLVQIEDHCLLAISVVEEVAVGIVEEDVAGIKIPQNPNVFLVLAGNRLAERGRILERESVLRKHIPHLAMFAVLLAGSMVAFVDHHKVLPLEALRRHHLHARALGAELVRIDDPHLRRVILEEVVGERHCGNSRCLQISQMLIRKPFVRRKQDDAIQRLPRLSGIPLVLEDVHVHQERLATPRRLPERHLVEVLQLCRRKMLLGGQGLVDLLDFGVQFVQKLRPAVEITVEIKFGHHQCQPLVVFHLHRIAVRVPPCSGRRDLLPISDHPKVVGFKRRLRHFRRIAKVEERTAYYGVEEQRMSRLGIDALHCLPVQRTA